MIEELKKRVSRLESTGTTQRPTLEAVQLHAAKIGLPPDQGDWFFNYYQSNGWRVGRNPMRSWQHALVNWKKNFELKGVGASSATGHTPSIRDLKIVLDAKHEEAKTLSDKYYNDSGAFHEWTNLPARTRYIQLKKEIQSIQARIGGAA